MADPTRSSRRGSLTQVHRPCARQAVDVVGAPAYDQEPPFDDRFSVMRNNALTQRRGNVRPLAQEVGAHEASRFRPTAVARAQGYLGTQKDT
jgi:hypothetical protein